MSNPSPFRPIDINPYKTSDNLYTIAREWKSYKDVITFLETHHTLAYSELSDNYLYRYHKARQNFSTIRQFDDVWVLDSEYYILVQRGEWGRLYFTGGKSRPY